MSVCVIGSGPAGVSAAQALISRGLRVVMLDTGFSLEPDRRAMVERMRLSEPQDWSPEDARGLEGDVRISAGGLEEKRVFGSSFANRPSAFFPLVRENAKFYLSFARGGLSSLWGRGILPLSEADARDWPFELSRLAPYYRRVLSFVPLAGRRDGLEGLYPLYTDSPSSVELSTQSRRLLERLEKGKGELSRRGVHFGRTRLAAEMDACRLCGKCMYGCPYGLLYSSDMTLDSLMAEPGFEYCPGVTVDRAEERKGSVVVHGVREPGGEPARFEVERVYVAAGSIASTRIILKSLEQYDRPVTAGCSDMYYMPTLSASSGQGSRSEKLYTLSQVMLEIEDESLSPYPVSIHLHGYNDLYLKLLRKAAGPASGILEPFMDFFLDRLFVLFAFFHSAHSAELRLSLKSDGSLEVRGRESPESQRLYAALRRKLFGTMRWTSLAPIPFYKKKRLPGQSMHFGSSFPMNASPQGMQSDVQGRVGGLERVHVVDGAVLPTIPAGSYTLTIMANAARIAAETEM